MRIGPDRHLPVMRLMMIAQRHDADIAKALNLRGLVRLGTGDIHCPCVALLQRAKVPAGFLFKNLRVRPERAIERRGGAGCNRFHRERNATCNGFLFHDIDMQRGVFHVHEMLAQPLEVDAAPVRFRIRLQFVYNFLDCGEGIVTRCGKQYRRRGAVVTMRVFR